MASVLILTKKVKFCDVIYIYIVEYEEVTLDTQVAAVPCTADNSTAGNMWKVWYSPYIILRYRLVVFHWNIIGVMGSGLWWGGTLFLRIVRIKTGVHRFEKDTFIK